LHRGKDIRWCRNTGMDDNDRPVLLRPVGPAKVATLDRHNVSVWSARFPLEALTGMRNPG
jgi:hypothetical protein